MNAFQIVVGILLLLFSIALIAVVLLQQGRDSGMGVISGAADSFLGKSKGRDLDSILSRFTKFGAIAFFVLIILINIVSYFKLG